MSLYYSPWNWRRLYHLFGLPIHGDQRIPPDAHDTQMYRGLRVHLRRADEKIGTSHTLHRIIVECGCGRKFGYGRMEQHAKVCDYARNTLTDPIRLCSCMDCVYNDRWIDWEECDARKKRNQNPYPDYRLHFRPEEPEKIIQDLGVEQGLHFPSRHRIPFRQEDVEEFVDYARRAFESVPNHLFEYTGGNFFPLFNCGWMIDPVCIQLVLFAPRNEPIPYLTTWVRGWDEFFRLFFPNQEPPGLDEIFIGAHYSLPEPTEDVAELNDEFADELESTGQWTDRYNTAGKRIITFNGEPPSAANVIPWNILLDI